MAAAQAEAEAAAMAAAQAEAEAAPIKNIIEEEIIEPVPEIAQPPIMEQPAPVVQSNIEQEQVNEPIIDEELGFEINENADNSYMSNISNLFDNINQPNANYIQEENNDYTYNYGTTTYSGESTYGSDDFGESIYNNAVIEPALEDIPQDTYENSLNDITNTNNTDFRKDKRFEMPNTDGGIQPEYSSPNKIQNVVVHQNSTNSVILSWDEYEGAKEYHLLHFNTKTKMYDDISKIKSTRTLLTGIIPSHTQQYKLVAYGFEKYERKLLASSRPISVSTSLPPVTGLESISATNNSLSFSWNEVPDAVKYVVYAFNSMKHTFVPADECTENFITLSNLVGISSLRVKVAAVKIIHNNECVTTLSDEVLAYTTIESVSEMTVTGRSSSSLKLSWKPIPSINAYKVYIYNPSTDKYDYADTTPFNQIVFNNLMPSCEYKFKVRACIITEEREVMGPPSSIFRAETSRPEF
jgi:fibronectin type 3 domain-containing protein